jgi:hypothetical protein
VILTLHAKRRLKQRFKIPGREHVNVVTEAYQKGHTIRKSDPKYWSFIKKKMSTKGGKFIVYKKMVFVFNGMTLVTVYKVPEYLL